MNTNYTKSINIRIILIDGHYIIMQFLGFEFATQQHGSLIITHYHTLLYFIQLHNKILFKGNILTNMNNKVERNKK